MHRSASHQNSVQYDGMDAHSRSDDWTPTKKCTNSVEKCNIFFQLCSWICLHIHEHVAADELVAEKPGFDMKQMRSLLDDHNIPDRDFIWDLMASSKLFQLNRVGEKVFLSPDYNLSMEDQRESTLARVLFLLEKGVFKGWLTKQSRELELQKSAIFEAVETFDHALAVKLGIHFRLWYKICPCMSNSFPHFVPALL